MNLHSQHALQQIVQLYQSNQLQEAERAISDFLLVTQNIRNAEAWHLSAAIALRLSLFSEALSRVDRAIQQQKTIAEYHNTRGAVLLELKRYQDAFESFSHALKLKPDYLEANRNCGLTLIQAKQFEQAERSLVTTIKKFPDDFQTWTFLAESRFFQGRYQGASEAANRAIGINAKNPSAHEILIRSFLKGGYRIAAKDAINLALKEFSSDSRFEELSAVYQAQFGSTEKAISYFESHLERSPESISARTNLAIAYLKAKRLEDFQLQFAKILKAPQADSMSLIGLGDELFRNSQYSDAELLYHHILKKEPQNKKAKVGLSRIFSATDRHDAGIVILESLGLEDACNLESLLIRSKLAIEKNDVETAIRHLRRFVAADPNHTEASLLLAKELLRISGAVGAVTGHTSARRLRLEEALIQTHRAIDDPTTEQSSEILLVQGRILHALQRHDEAILALNNSLQFDSSCAETYFALGFCYVEQGYLDLAEENFLMAIKCNPVYAKAHYQLAISIKTNAPESRLAEVERIIKESTPSKADEILLHFAKARYHDALKDHDAAFDEYAKANSLKPSPQNDELLSENHPANPVAMMSELAEIFSKEFFETRENFGSQSERPIFIVGMPRSGTTLTEQILSSHSQVHGAGELNEINDLRHMIERLCNDRPSRYPHAVKDLSQDDVLLIVKRHGRMLNFHNSKLRFVTDKMPTNFLHLGLIALMYPNAKIIHCTRDLRDIAVSSIRQNLDWPFCDLEQIAHYMNAYQKLMKHWSVTIPNPIHAVVYEDLVSNPDVEIPKLIEFCDLQWEEDCLNFQESSRTVITPSKTQVRQPMYTSSIGSWKRYEKHLKPLIERLKNG